MNDGIPFEADPLRYGGDKRESGMQHWIDILEEFDLPYYVVPLGTPYQQTNAVCRAVIKMFEEQTKHIREYKR